MSLPKILLVTYWNGRDAKEIALDRVLLLGGQHLLCAPASRTEKLLELNFDSSHSLWISNKRLALQALKA